jgi:hypothetical protein
MLRGVKVLGGVRAWGLVATADVPALLAHPEMYPAGPDLEALLTSVWRPGRYISDFSQVPALLYHDISPAIVY